MENTLENKAKFFAQFMIDGQKFILSEESYYDTSDPKESIGHGLKEQGFSFVFDWCLTPNAFRYGSGVFPFNFISRSAVELEPISSITDEDYYDYYCSDFFPSHHKKADDEKLRGWGHSELGIWQIKSQCGKSVMEAYYYDKSSIVDFLRSRGYALPWMGLSVKTLIEYGWIKLNQPPATV